jgi:signal transduction histidine kinase/FixJ family two-component response regulator
MAASQSSPTPPSRPDFVIDSGVCVRLEARGRILGAMTLAFRVGRQSSSADPALIEDLAGRAAIALDNARLYRNIQEGDRLKNEFLAMLAHELRNPLAPIRNAVQILRRDKIGRAEQEFARDIIDRQVGQMVRIVDDLLDVSRITRGKISLRKETVDLTAVAARAVETSRPLIELRKQTLSVKLPACPIPAHGDATRLAQVLANLLNNAAKFTGERGSISLTLEQHDKEAVFHICDTGVGIPADMLSSIFDLFIQADRTLDRSQGGLWIGLTLVRRLVEMHGGSVHAFSDGPNRGSDFVVRLPTLQEAEIPAVSVNGTRPAAARSDRRRVLVVDDNIDSAETLAMVLRQCGHDVKTAHDGPSTLDVAVAYRPDVVLLDIGLPGMDGYEVARRLKQQPGMESLCIAAVTGYGQPDDRRRAREAGFQHHFIKPVDLQMLQDVLAQTCRLASSHELPAEETQATASDIRK